MRCNRFWLAAALLLVGASRTHAGLVDLSVNDESVDLAVGVHLGSEEAGRFAVGGRLVYSDDGERDATVPAAFALFSGHPEANAALEFRLGAQALVGEAQDQDVYAVTLGGGLTWTPESWHGAYFGGSIFVSPGVLSFGDTDNVLEWEVQGGYRLTPALRVYLEYAEITVDTENVDDVDVLDGLRIGLHARF